jgi:hypothetical protein
LKRTVASGLAPGRIMKSCAPGGCGRNLLTEHRHSGAGTQPTAHGYLDTVSWQWQWPRLAGCGNRRSILTARGLISQREPGPGEHWNKATRSTKNQGRADCLGSRSRKCSDPERKAGSWPLACRAEHRKRTGVLKHPRVFKHSPVPYNGHVWVADATRCAS